MKSFLIFLSNNKKIKILCDVEIIYTFIFLYFCNFIFTESYLTRSMNIS